MKKSARDHRREDTVHSVRSDDWDRVAHGPNHDWILVGLRSKFSSIATEMRPQFSQILIGIRQRSNGAGAQRGSRVGYNVDDDRWRRNRLEIAGEKTLCIPRDWTVESESHTGRITAKFWTDCGQNLARSLSRLWWWSRSQFGLIMIESNWNSATIGRHRRPTGFRGWL